MAIFGLFGKKDGKSATAEKSASSDKTNPPTKPAAGPAAPGAPVTVPARPRRDQAAAKATAKKIDAIESEMSEEFTSARVPSGNTLPAPAQVQRVQSPPPSTRPPDPHQIFESTLPSIGMSTEFLLGPQAKSTDIVVSAESAQVVEEAAILYASGQAAMAEQVLLVAVQGDNLIDGGQRPWWMLFELFQLSGRQAEFDNLSITFASRFETSPPSWRNMESEDLLPASQMLPKAAALPTVAFVGKLDASIVRLLEKVQKLGESSSVLRLEFTKVTEVDPVGCGLLLKILKRLQASSHELVLVGANELAGRIRAILQVGRRDETEAPWLLLLEILRLLNSEVEFEEASMDYCVTFEVSPPAFDAPRKVTTEKADSANPQAAAFSMPSLVEGKAETLLAAIAEFAATHDPAAIDCSRLRRIDFTAAGQLLSGLAPVVAGGRVVEFVEVNHMVGALMDVIGLKEIARISIRKG